MNTRAEEMDTDVRQRSICLNDNAVLPLWIMTTPLSAFPIEGSLRYTWAVSMWVKPALRAARTWKTSEGQWRLARRPKGAGLPITAGPPASDDEQRPIGIVVGVIEGHRRVSLTDWLATWSGGPLGPGPCPTASALLYVLVALPTTAHRLWVNYLRFCNAGFGL